MMLSQVKTEMCGVLFQGHFLPVQKKVMEKKWECHLSEMMIGEYFLVPINSEKMIRDESYWMNDWCKRYVKGCAQGEYALFSIRSCAGERQATLGLSREEEGWHLDRCTGHLNAEVLEETQVYIDEMGDLQYECFPTEIYYVAQEIVRLMNIETSTVM